MGTADASRQSPTEDAPPRPVAAFDFDGTLTVRDSFVAFLVWRTGLWGAIQRLLDLAPEFAAYGLHRDRGRLKAALARRFLGGVSLATVTADAERFAAEAMPGLMRPDALDAWADWKRRGARAVIVTASPEIIVSPFAKALDADVLIGTRLAVDAGGRLTGDLEGPNCRGPEKVRRLRARFGEALNLVAAYGDTSGDTDMLAMAEEAGFRRFRARP